MSISIEAHDRICQDLHQQIRSLIVENERLKAAAQQALEALEGGADSWQRVGPAIDALKAALAEKALHIDTLRMAREAGFAVEDGGVYTPDAYGPGDVTQLVKRFAALVAAAEREACAKVCESRADEEVGMAYEGIALDCAAAIRAKGWE